MTAFERADASGDALVERVSRALEEFLARQTKQITGIDDRLIPKVDAITALTAAGKRLRPLFCYWGWRGAGQPDRAEIIVASAALELLQASALIHDDVIDDSDTRRGKPATHRRLAEYHAAQGWAGSADQFGVAGAILAGDLCLSWSEEMLRTCGLPAERLLPALRYFDTMRGEVIGGQFLDLVNQASQATSVADAMRVVRYKAAKYTVERPLHLGGALAGASTELMRSYSEFGLPIGEAFQLRDDVLGVFGDPEVTGKPAGDDLREGKRTVLVAKTLEAASHDQAERFHHWFGSPDLDLRGVTELRELIVETGALAAVERLIAELTTTALASLEAMPLADPAVRAPLAELADAATRRVV